MRACPSQVRVAPSSPLVAFQACHAVVESRLVHLDHAAGQLDQGNTTFSCDNVATAISFQIAVTLATLREVATEGYKPESDEFLHKTTLGIQNKTNQETRLQAAGENRMHTWRKATSHKPHSRYDSLHRNDDTSNDSIAMKRLESLRRPQKAHECLYKRTRRRYNHNTNNGGAATAIHAAIAGELRGMQPRTRTTTTVTSTHKGNSGHAVLQTTDNTGNAGLQSCRRKSWTVGVLHNC